MIAKVNYINELARAKALLAYQKNDAAKYAALPTAKAFVSQKHQENIKALEDFIISVIGYVQELESLQRPVTDSSGKVVHLYHYPKDEDTIHCLAITQCMSYLKQYTSL